VAVAAVAVLLPLLAASSGVGVMRPVTLQTTVTDGEPHPYCTVLDASAFAEAEPGLRGLHLMQDGTEIAVLTTVSEPLQEQTETVRILHLQEQHGGLSFDLGMPRRAYTQLVFHLRLKDYVATGQVSAKEDPATHEFTLYDLSGSQLGSQSIVELPEMQASMLHVALSVRGRTLRKDDLAGVDVGPDRAAQSVYTVVATVVATAVATTAEFAHTQRESIVEFDVPAHVPVQRIRFEWSAAALNFLRRVRVEAWPASDPNDVETISGTISDVEGMHDGVRLSDAQRDVPMTLGANLQGPAHVRVIVENNGDEPLALQQVTLEMREHKLCFAAKKGAPITLYEGGDSKLPDLVPTLPQQAWDTAGMAVLGAPVKGVSPEIFTANPHHRHVLEMVRTLFMSLCLIGVLAYAAYRIRSRFAKKNRTLLIEDPASKR
jgi:hypothetical protein